MEQTRENNRTDELLERIHQLECKEAIILKESHELREQNELLEFRIIELEEGGDKVSLLFSIRISSDYSLFIYFANNKIIKAPKGKPKSNAIPNAT